MGLQTYVFLLFGISIAFYFLGSTPMMFSQLGCDINNNATTTCTPSKSLAEDFITDIINAIANNPIVLGLLGISIVSSILIGGTFIVVFAVPAIMLLVAANFYLLPTDFMYNEALPFEIRLIFFGFMNLMLIMIIITFIRGGE